MSIAVQDLSGLYPAIITPMGRNGQIDYGKLDRLIEDFIAAEVSGICACGTTGQSPALSEDEHREILLHVKKRIDGRCQLIVGAGSNATAKALTQTTTIERDLGATTFLHVTGYYNNPPQAGLCAHFIALAEALRHPESNIIPYNVPSRTASNIEPDTVVALAKHPRIVGIKESSGNLDQVNEIIARTDPTQFRVLTGECHQIAEVIASGGFGAISAAANVAPRLLARLVAAGLAGDLEQARALQERAKPVIGAVFAAKNPIPLAMMFSCDVRLPLVLLEELRQSLVATMARYECEELGIDLHSYAGG
jgi:4-hydroxy-tetrahydrodipicolinate synthase